MPNQSCELVFSFNYSFTRQIKTERETKREKKQQQSGINGKQTKKSKGNAFFSSSIIIIQYLVCMCLCVWFFSFVY